MNTQDPELEVDVPDCAAAAGKDPEGDAGRPGKTAAEAHPYGSSAEERNRKLAAGPFGLVYKWSHGNSLLPDRAGTCAASNALCFPCPWSGSRRCCFLMTLRAGTWLRREE